MTRTSLVASALLLALGSLSACADSSQTTGMASQADATDPEAAARYAEFTGQGATSADCVAGGGMTVAGMPATEHQMEVLGDEAAQAAATEPAAGCPDAGGMPATQHQQEVIEDGAAEGGSY